MFNIENQIPTNLTDDEEVSFQNTEVCHIREKVFEYSDLKYNKELKREDLYSSLNGEDISQEDFIQYLKVWSLLKEKKTLVNYSGLYNISNVLLLADIFENFRDIYLRNYKLDLAQYLTSLSLV